MFLPYVYKVTHKTTSEVYIGMRSANQLPAEEDLGIHYFTSNKTVQKHFAEFDIFIYAYFLSWEDAFIFENNLIKSNWGDCKLLNKHYQLDINKFSMLGHRRPDVSEQNKRLKRKPKEIRDYSCIQCHNNFQIEQFCHHLQKKKPLCSRRCAATHASTYPRKPPNRTGIIPWNKGKTGIYSDATKEKMSARKKGKTAWNRGIPNPLASLNGKKGAKKLSEKVIGRKRKYLPNGSFTWEYPVHEARVDSVSKSNPQNSG